MDVKVEQRVGVLVDVLNLFFAAKNIHHANVDYAKMLKLLVDNNICTRAVAYVIRKPDAEQAGFVAALQHIGYEVKVRELRRHTDRDGNAAMDRSSWSVGIAVDALALAPRLDVLILVTGNSDFVPLIEAVQGTGCKVIVAGIQGSLSQDLIKAADAHRILGEDVMFRKEGAGREAVTTRPPVHHGSMYGVEDEVDYLNESEKVMPAVKEEKDGGGFGILGSSAADALDKAGLPK